MPELPEVETIAQDLREAKIKEIKITNVQVFFGKSIANFDPMRFCRELIGKKIVSIDRRGKFLVLGLDNKMALLIHLRMSGRLNIVSNSVYQNKHEHIIVSFESGLQLRFHDPRKFGRWYLVDNATEITHKLGPEPLSNDFLLPKFKKALLSRKRQIKPLLLDQSFLAGLGNIYVDEALWEARIHPETLSSHLHEHEIEGLFNSIRFVLKRGVESKGTSLGTGKSNYARLNGIKGEHQTILSVFRRTGLPCPRCITPIERIIVGQRSSHICPKCQKVFKL